MNLISLESRIVITVNFFVLVMLMCFVFALLYEYLYESEDTFLIHSLLEIF